MPIHAITSIDDSRIRDYRDLPGQSPAGGFVVEGRHLVERLIASKIGVRSILAKPGLAEEFASLTDAEVSVYSAEIGVISELVGFRFHRGVLAVGERPLQSKIEAAIPPAPQSAVLAVCVGVQNRENLGGVLRNAAGLGCNGVLLDSTSADPFARRSLRVSMGAPLFFPTETTADISARLQEIRSTHGFMLIAATLSPAATPLLHARNYKRVAVLFGSEANGLPADLLELCDDQICIPMAPDIDSLNVASASAIVLHHFRG